MTLPIRTWPEQQEHERLMRNTASRCAWLRSLTENCINLNDAARKFQCPPSTLQRLASKYDVKFPNGTTAKKSAVDEQVLRAMARKGATAREAAKRFECSREAVRNFAMRRGIPLKIEEPAYRPPKPKPPEPKAITGLDVMAMFAARESAAARRQWNR